MYKTTSCGKTSTGGIFMKKIFAYAAIGCTAGTINGLFGTGGGMVLVPLLSAFTDIKSDTLFPSSVAILLPICIVSLLFSSGWESFSYMTALPYLLGSVLGGVCAGIWGKKIPSTWLHRGLGLLILWGGIRYLW